MDSKAEMYFKRARSEIDSASVLFRASGEQNVKDVLGIGKEETFYSGAISHAYYAIFYCAKAMLMTKSIETGSPDIHKKTFEKFKKVFIDTGILDAKLLMIYRELIIRAETLLEIYKIEKKKRGDFTYNTIPQVNKAPAEESVNHAKMFFKHRDTYLSDWAR